MGDRPPGWYPIDTTTAQRRLIFNLFASLAEFEREVMRKHTQAGLSAARARGRAGGCPKSLPRKAEATAYAAATLYREGRLSAQEIADKLHLSKSTRPALSQRVWRIAIICTMCNHITEYKWPYGQECAPGVYRRRVDER
jgi:DNA invertase Pin-like site-specific DNA recombinase